MNEKELHINDELDDLKSLWKNQPDEKNYDREDIFKMIHRKSVNSVQWLFIITIVEFLIGLTLSLWTILSGTHLYSEDNIKIVGKESFERVENFSHLGLIGSVILLIIMFYFYRKTTSALSVQGLMSTILKFRKIVMWFIVLWISFTMILFVPLIMEIGVNSYMNASAHENESLEEASRTARQVGYVMVGINLALILIFCGLYYGIIYGIFLRRLGKNLKELKNLEN